MLAKVIIENGVKKIQALTADTGTGAPVGSYLYLEKKSNPQGYLYCDGSTFDETVYPALYQYLGTNVLPDWREFSAVGAEQNTTNVYDASTNPNGVIHDHDVYAQGEAKDDQLQDHSHDLKQGDTLINKGSTTVGRNVSSVVFGDGNVYGYVNISNNDGRKGTTTHGKQKAVYIYIKATSGLTENQQENVLNTINENNSYSTEEHPTGKKWIDGKPIYSKVVDFGALPNATYKVVAHNISNLDKILKIEGITSSSNNVFTLPYVSISAMANSVSVYISNADIRIETGIDRSSFTTTFVTLEYTKTTD